MFKNVASQKLIVYAYDATTGAPKTGDAANLTAYVSKDFGAVTVLGDTSATEMDATNAKGSYLFDLTQGETNADCAHFTGKSSTSNIYIAPQTIYTDPPNYTTLSVDGSGRAKGDVDTIKTQAVTCAAGVTVLASVGTAATSTAQTGDNFARLGAPAGASVSADIVAINAKTTNLPAAPASTTNITAGTIATVSGNVNGNVGGSVASVTGLTASNLDASISSVKSKTDLIPGTQDGKTFAQTLLLMAVTLLGKASGLGTATAVFRALDDSKDRVTTTVDASGNRTATTLDAS